MLVPDRDNLRPPIRLYASIGAPTVPAATCAAGEGRSWLLAGSGDVNSAGLLTHAATEGDAGEPTRADVQRAGQRACRAGADGRRSSCPHGPVAGLGHLADAGARVHSGALFGFRRAAAGRPGRVGDVVPHAHAGARRLPASGAQRRLACRLRRRCRQSRWLGALPAVLCLLRDRGSCNVPCLQPRARWCRWSARPAPSPA